MGIKPKVVYLKPKTARPPLKMRLSLTIDRFDKDGKLIDSETVQSRSYVLAWMTLLFVELSYVTSPVTILDTGGTARSPAAGAQALINAGSGVVTYGIVVGTGTNVVTPSDNKLQTPITNGAGAGQLVHSGMIIGAPTSTATTVKITAARTLTNNSGSTITVTEVGIYVSWSSVYYCVVRDKLGASKGILTTTSATLTYTLELTT
jgi:hypothetical protein